MIQDTPLITVAMVTYNSSKYLQDAIESVLSSTFESYELIICDDCSTDHTSEIITSFADKSSKIRFIENETNIGEYPNRNKCLALAKGKYIIYIDGDDKIYPHGLETFYKQIEKHSGAGMWISRPVDERFSYPHTLEPTDSMKVHYLDKTVLNMALVRTMFSVEKLRSVGGFSENFKSGDDYIRTLMAMNFPLVLLEDGLVWWRKSQGSASERLFTSYEGILEPTQIKMLFLNNEKNPLSVADEQQALEKIKTTVKQKKLSLIKRGKWKQALRYHNDTKSY